MKYRSWFSRMERQFPKLEQVNIRVTWIDGETFYIKRMAPVDPNASTSSHPAQDPAPLATPKPSQPNLRKQNPPGNDPGTDQG